MDSPIKNVRIGVANRGIPALRIGRTIQEMGGIYVAFATEEDKTAPHVTKADKAY
ncbi:MAG: acetyl-CoA carboxylase biotin carboxylase subunit, partial [Deltaproteobacteria bacterium]|nr:acetyl-CoA carboxylase biotin carboxylase subunit [Deltaproteobacteria bacterium]